VDDLAPEAPPLAEEGGKKDSKKRKKDDGGDDGKNSDTERAKKLGRCLVFNTELFPSGGLSYRLSPYVAIFTPRM
jgi:hypothetical protein